MSMKLFAGCVGDLARAAGPVLAVTSFRPLPNSFFVCETWDLVRFILLWRFACALVELSWWDVKMGARRTEGTVGTWARTRHQHKCIVGFFFLFLITVYSLPFVLNFRRRNYFFLNFSTPVYKTWIIQEPNTLELWNKLHFEEKKRESIYRV